MNMTEQMRVIGRRLGHLLALAVLVAFLVAAEASCAGEKESPPEEDTSYPGMAITVYKGPAAAPAEDEAATAAARTVEEGRAMFDATATAEAEAEVAEAGELAQLEYLVEADLLLGEGVEVIDDFSAWMADVVTGYELGVMFPDRAAGESALDRMKDVTGRVESLNVPPAFQESYDLMLAAHHEAVTGMELVVAGAEQFDPGLVDQGTVHFFEATRLIRLATDALERAE